MLQEAHNNDQKPKSLLEARQKLLDLQDGIMQIEDQLESPHRRERTPEIEYLKWRARAKHAIEIKARMIRHLEIFIEKQELIEGIPKSPNGNGAKTENPLNGSSSIMFRLFEVFIAAEKYVVSDDPGEDEDDTLFDDLETKVREARRVLEQSS